MRLILALLLIMGISSPAQAQFCSEPLEPVCLEPSTNFDSDIARTRCIADLELFKERLADYTICLGDMIENIEKKSEEIDERLSNLSDKLDDTTL